MVNKKGFMRILEATISIVLILSALIILSSRQESVEEKDLGVILPKILDEIAREPNLRIQIIRGDNPDLNSFVGERINNPSLEHAVKICALDEVCVLDNFPDGAEEIFASERVVSAVIDEPFEPKKVKIFLWRKE